MLGLSIEITYPRMKVRSRCEWPCAGVYPKNVFGPIWGAAVHLWASVIAHSFLRLLAREVPTVVDEFLDVIGIESQRASTRSHFHSRKIGLAFPRCMLNHPGDAHSQLLSDIPRPHELPNRPEFSGCADSARVEIHPIDSGYHTLVRTNALHDLYLRQRRDWGQKSPETGSCD
jgi:hypothetical protein